MRTTTATTPTTATNIDAEGNPDIPWSRVAEELAAHRWGVDGPSFWLSTATRDGRVHTTGIAALWQADGFWFTSGPGSRKSRNLRANPSCTVSLSTSGSEPGMDVVVEGTAHHVTDPHHLTRVTAAYAAQGWPAEPDGDGVTAPFWAQTAGPPPWDLWHVRPDRIHVLAVADPAGAMRFTFGAAEVRTDTRRQGDPR